MYIRKRNHRSLTRR